MARRSSSTFDFSDVVQGAIRNYTNDVISAATEVIPQVAKEAAARLRKESPKRTGEYAKGWTYKVETKRLTTVATVYGKHGTYQLAHLLEFGHAKRGGGRTEGTLHITPVEEWAVDEAIDRIMDKVEGI